jgi:hypothetical protein
MVPQGIYLALIKLDHAVFGGPPRSKIFPTPLRSLQGKRLLFCSVPMKGRT